MLNMWAVSLFHHLPERGCLIKSPCDLLILWAAEGNDSSSSSSSVKPSGGGSAPPPPPPNHSKWAPKTSSQSYERGGISLPPCGCHVFTPIRPLLTYLFLDRVAQYASDKISQRIADCWPAPATFMFHLPAKYYSSVVKRCLCGHFPDNASIFFFIISGRCLHCFIGDRDPFHLALEATLDESKGGGGCGWSCPAVKLDLLVASLFAPVWKTAGSRLSVCGEHLFHCAG